ncbi:MAG: tetratricopeptide repeat protein [Phycisphaerae bacterium]|nr:tetratricopeptide repeat protein [Phycisphaerae bacterium]
MIALALALPAVAQTSEPPGAASAARASKYQTGMALLNRGLNDAAEKELRAFLDENPNAKDSPSARYALGIALFRQGRFNDAAAELANVVSLDGFKFAPDATLLRAQCLARAGDDRGAAQALESLASFASFTRQDEGAVLRAECLQRLGRHEDVLAALGDFESRWPTSKLGARAALLLSISGSALGRHEDAARHAERVLSRPDAADLAPRAALVAARAREALGQRDQARAHYQRAADAPDPAIKGESLVAGARLARASGDRDAAGAALDAFDTLSQHNPTDAESSTSLDPLVPWAAYERARLSIDAGDHAAALSLLAPLARSVSPGSPGSARSDLGSGKATLPPALVEQTGYWAARCESALGKLDQAAARLGTLSRAFPTGALAAETLFDLATAQSRAGRAADAIASFEAFLSRHAGHAWSSDASAALASAYLATGDAEHAAGVCEKALSAKPSPAGARSLTLLLGESRFIEKDYARAAESYAAFLRLAPEDAGAWRARVRLALCALRTESPDARRMLRAALDAPLTKAAPGEPSAGDDGARRTLAIAALSELADADAAARDWPEAARAYSQLVTLQGDAPDRQNLLRLGVSLRQAGRARDAVAPLSRAIEASAIEAHEPGVGPAATDPTSDAARLELARSLIELGDLSEASSAVAPLGQRTSAPRDESERATRVAALRLLASIASKGGRPDDAARHLAAAGALSGDDDASADLRLDQGLALMGSGDLAGAAAAFTAFIERHGAHPRRNEAAARLSIALARLGKHADAAVAFASIKGGAIPPALRDAADYESAMGLVALGKHTDARARLESLASGAGDAGVRLAATLELARQLLDASKPTDALARLDAFSLPADTDADHGADADASLAARAVYYRARALLALDRPRDAADLLAKEASRLASSDIAPAAQLLTGDAMARAGRLDESLSALASLLAASPAPAIRSAALLLQGDTAAAAQRWRESEHAFTSFLGEFGESDSWFRARFGLGQALEAQDRHADAIDAYRDVAARHAGATAARAQFQIGECLIALGKHQDALTELVKVDAAFAEPEWSAAALYEVGRVLVMLRRPSDAARQFDEVVSRFPESQWAAMAKGERAKLAPAPLPGRRDAAATPDARTTGDR